MRRMILTKKDIYKGPLILVNSELPIRYEQPDKLVPVDERYRDILMEREAANALHQVFEKIAADDIVPVSGYRSHNEQSEIYRNSLFENGDEFTCKYVALPDHSEHQTGLAIDLGQKSDSIDFIRPDFPDYGSCKAFRIIASDFGFILRYEKDKEAVTKIAYEPWHFRYVGYPHSKIISNNGMSLENYIDFIKNYSSENPLKYKQYEIFYIPLQDEKTVVEIEKNGLFHISGNNSDGFIVTLRSEV